MTEGLAEGNYKNVLPLGGHFLSLAPAGIQLHVLAVDFYGLIGAHPYIILLLGSQLFDRLRSGLVLGDIHRFIALFEFRRCTVLHLISGGLSGLLFPFDLKALLGGGHLGHAGALGVNVISYVLTAVVIFLKDNLNGVFTHIFHAIGIKHIVVLTAL